MPTIADLKQVHRASSAAGNYAAFADPRRPAAVRIAHCPFIVETPGISAQFLDLKPAGPAARKRGFAGDFCILGAAGLLLAMQKVEGSNPFSRFHKACICRSFS
jgi:hypothetical protein